MSSLRIYDLDFDDENKDKLSRRGISMEDALDLISSRYAIVRNKRRGRGRYKVIGRDGAGRILTMILEPTRVKTTWRPVTGWPSTGAEKKLIPN